MLLQALLDAGHGIRRHVHPSIFAPFPLHDLHGLLLPIDLLQLEVGHLGDPEATARITRNSARSIGWAIWAKSRWTCSRGGLWAGDAHAGQSDWA